MQPRLRPRSTLQVQRLRVLQPRQVVTRARGRRPHRDRRFPRCPLRHSARASRRAAIYHVASRLRRHISDAERLLPAGSECVRETREPEWIACGTFESQSAAHGAPSEVGTNCRIDGSPAGAELAKSGSIAFGTQMKAARKTPSTSWSLSRHAGSLLSQGADREFTPSTSHHEADSISKGTHHPADADLNDFAEMHVHR
jgi:hypothetical protein